MKIGFPKLPDIWRVLRDGDVEAIHRQAEKPFDVVVVGGFLADAEAVALLLSGTGGRHPWLRVAEAAEGGRTPASGMADLGLIVTREADLSPPLAAVLASLRTTGVPVVTIVTGSRRATDGLVRPGETARASVPALDAAVVPAIAQVLLSAVTPAVRLAMARHLPGLRESFFSELIEETANANAAYALSAGVAEIVPGLSVPLNLADVVVITKNQLVMSYKIALAAGRRGTPRELIGQVVAVIGGGLLFRQGARQLVGLVPLLGIAPKVAVAYAGTWAIGRAVVAWAAEGSRLSKDAVRRFYREAWERGKQAALRLGTRARPRLPWARRSGGTTTGTDS